MLLPWLDHKRVEGVGACIACQHSSAQVVVSFKRDEHPEPSLALKGVLGVQNSSLLSTVSRRHIGTTEWHSGARA